MQNVNAYQGILPALCCCSNCTSLFFIYDITFLFQTCKLIRQRNSLIKQEACSKLPHTYAAKDVAMFIIIEALINVTN